MNKYAILDKEGTLYRTGIAETTTFQQIRDNLGVFTSIFYCRFLIRSMHYRKHYQLTRMQLYWSTTFKLMKLLHYLFTLKTPMF